MARYVRIHADKTVTSRLYGVNASLGALQKYKYRIGQANERGLKKALTYLLRETLPVTPKDTGRLRRSGKVHMMGKRETARGYVAFHAPYAVYVHENLFVYHKPPTMAKFLERTAKRLRLNMRALIVFEIQDACRKALASAARRRLT